MKSFSGRLALSLVVSAALVAAAVPAVSATSPATARSSAIRCTHTLGTDGKLVTNLVSVGGNGADGRTQTAYVAARLNTEVWMQATADRAQHRSLTRARLESVEHRGQRAAYFARTSSRVDTLVRLLRSRAAGCPNDAQALLGYSQGALVVRLALRKLGGTAAGRAILDHVGSVVLVGDPAASPRDRVTRFGTRGNTGVLRTSLPLPTVLTSRGLVSSWCAPADPVCHSTRATRRGDLGAKGGARPVRGHLAYRLRKPTASTAKAATALRAHVLGRLDPTYSWRLTRVSPVAASPRAGDQFTFVATTPSTFRPDRAASELPSGVAVGDDLSLSGTAPPPGSDVAIIRFSDSQVAPAVTRTTRIDLDTWVRSTARPGVRSITHGPGGAPANGASSLATVSNDGQHVAFVSAASNLVADDTNGAQLDVFSWDRASDTFRRLAVGALVGRPRPSADGRYVSFVSDRQLVPSDSDQLADAFVWDTVSGTVQLASPTAGAATAVTGTSISADGATVWTRVAQTVTAYDRVTETAADVPPPPGTTWAAGYDGAAWIASASGRYAVTRDTGYQVYDRTSATSGGRCLGAENGTAHLVSDDGQVLSGHEVTFGGREPVTSGVMCRFDGTRLPKSGDPQDFSADGSTWLTGVVVSAPPHTSASSVYPNGTGYTIDYKSLSTPDTTKVLPWDLPSSLSSDGSAAVFSYVASNLIETDPVLWGQPDVYLWDRTVSP